MHTKSLLLVICSAMLTMTCRYNQQVDPHVGFRDIPSDTIVVKAKVAIQEVFRLNQKYYCTSFQENDAIQDSRIHLFPPKIAKERYLFARNDSLFAWDNYREPDGDDYYYNPETEDWETITTVLPLYEKEYDDDKWSVRFVYHGEFGHVMWFIDKQSSQEYGFPTMIGAVHKADSSFYIVSRPRVYKLDDPTRGHLCDSSEIYVNVRKERILFWPFGFNIERIQFPPVIKYDDDDWDCFDVWEEAKVDTIIVGSFVSRNHLHFLRETPSATELIRLDDEGTTLLHAFPRYSKKNKYSHPYREVAISCHTFPDPNHPGDELLFVVAKRDDYSFDLYEIGPEGNTLIRLDFDT